MEHRRDVCTTPTMSYNVWGRPPMSSLTLRCALIALPFWTFSRCFHASESFSSSSTAAHHARTSNQESSSG